MQNTSWVALKMYRLTQKKITTPGQVHLSLRSWGVTKKRTTWSFLSAYIWYILSATWLVFSFNYIQEIKDKSNQIIKFPSVQRAEILSLLAKCHSNRLTIFQGYGTSQLYQTLFSIRQTLIRCVQ